VIRYPVSLVDLRLLERIDVRLAVDDRAAAPAERRRIARQPHLGQALDADGQIREFARSDEASANARARMYIANCAAEIATAPS
jgi:hypothetical protein